jgi:HEAT repeat protein
MKTFNLSGRNWIGAFLTAMVTITFTSTLPAPVLGAPPTEDRLIADLASPNEKKVVDALLKLEKEYPNSTKAFPTMKALLKDSRPKVRRKAARVLGVLHAEVDADNVKAICALLKAQDTQEIIDGLKALRGLKAPESVAEILPLLKHSHPNVIRDSCRTLAVLGNKDLIPSIEPLLKHPNAAVVKDAQDALFILRGKS